MKNSTTIIKNEKLKNEKLENDKDDSCMAQLIKGLTDIFKSNNSPTLSKKTEEENLLYPGCHHILHL